MKLITFSKTILTFKSMKMIFMTLSLMLILTMTKGLVKMNFYRHLIIILIILDTLIIINNIFIIVFLYINTYI